MAKYDSLRDHLMSVRGNRWRATFREIEALLGAPLPLSARTYEAWWSNRGGPRHVQATAWLKAGWLTADLDMAGERVTFERQR